MKKIIRPTFLYLRHERVLTVIPCRKRGLYFPGGLRKDGESACDVLIHEVKRGLGVDIIPGTLARYGDFETLTAGGDMTVRLECYTGSIDGVINPARDIIDMAYWASYSDLNRFSPSFKDIVTDLESRRMLR